MARMKKLSAENKTLWAAFARRLFPRLCADNGTRENVIGTREEECKHYTIDCSESHFLFRGDE